MAVPPLPKSFEAAARLRIEVEAELERVCQSPQFGSSQRSCEFLRFVVCVALDGRTDSLKERSIGIDLLGRDSSYDPATDATVRVRANEVRKRLGLYYGSNPVMGPLRIVLPKGHYVPLFVNTCDFPVFISSEETTNGITSAKPISRSVSPLSGLVLMGPALLALLICVLLLRHQLVNREDYLRFWDHYLSGRSKLVLMMAPEDRDQLAPGLDPLVWIAGRYGVETTMAAAPMSRAEAATLTVGIASVSPPVLQKESRLRWLLSENRARPLTDLHPTGQNPSGLVHIALLTILPEAPSTLYVQGTDQYALRSLFEDLTTSGILADAAVEPLTGNKPVQLLVCLDATGHWTAQTWVVQP